MGISFLSPWLLGGAALVAAPIILHLVMRRKPVPHPFPALRFLQQRAVANRRRLQLSHLLLLLLRMAAVLLLALALARPVLRGAGWLPESEGPVAAAFVFDTAPRMTLREGNRTRLEQAAALARVLFDKLPAGSQVAVVDTAGTPPAFGPAAAAEGRVDRLTASPASISLPAAIAAARRLLTGTKLERRELYVFTDCSRGAWGTAALAGADQPDARAGGIPLYVDVGSRTPRNLALETLELGADRVATGSSLVLTATVTGTGSVAGRPVAVEILGGDERFVRRAVKNVSPGAERPETVSFEIGGLEPGIRQGRVILDGSDDLAADDVRSFTVEVGAAGRVIVASASPAARTGRFLIEALAPAPLRKAGTARFAPEAVDFSSLDATTWEGAAGMILLDPPPLPARDWESLAAWVAAGHGLVVWLGPAAGTAAGFNSAASRRLLGGDIVRVWRSPEAGNYLAPAALDHPVLAAFRRVGDAVPWQDFPVFRHWEFTPAERAADEAERGSGAASVVASYRDGLPAILEHRLGQGTVIVVTTPVGQAAADPESWNVLATGFEPWPFLILANETLRHAIDTAADRNVLAGRPVTLHLGRRDLPTAIVHTPAGDDFPVAIDRGRGTVTVTATLQPGNYTVRAGGGAEGVSDGFSVTLDPAATDFQRLSDDRLAEVLGPGHRLARTEEELVRDVNRERIGSELFGWAIVLAALAMAADWIVANRFYAPRSGTEPPADAATIFAESGAGDAEQVVEPASAATPGPPPLPPLAGARP